MNNQRPIGVVLLLSVCAAAFLAGCGGGSSTAASSSTPQASTLQGTAATGTALANAVVSIIDTTGASACVEAGIVTLGTGNFTCTLKAGETAPFFVSVTDPAGRVAPLVSVTTTTPPPGTALVVNATPLTTAIVAQLSADRNALTVFNNKAVDANALAQVTAHVIAQLQPVLAAINAAAGYDPFTTGITAASAAGTGNTADLVLDIVKVGADGSGNLTLSTIDSPAGVPMADASNAGALLPAPSAGVSALSVAMQALGKALTSCFALPTAARVLVSDTTIPYSMGGSEVTQVAPACQGLTDPAFLQNGFRAGQLFFGILTSDSMNGAQFSVPEVMLFFQHSASQARDTAVVNLRYIDANGVAGNTITVAVDQGTGTASPNWVLFGNQQPVNVAIRATIRLQQQQAPVTQAPFNTSAPLSTYQTGIELYVDKNGPGSANLTAARVSGPGLPAGGILLNQPTPAFQAQQSWLNIADKSGGSPAAFATQLNTCNCDIFFLERTQDITGAGATTVRSNPNAGNSNNGQFVNWAHPLDYGAPLNTPTDQYVPLGSFAIGATYKVELFYNGSATATHTYNKTLLTPVIAATRGSALPWNAPSAATLRLLDPNDALSAAAASFAVDWTQNLSAEQIRLGQAFTGGGGTSVNQGNGIGVSKSATSVIITAPSGLQFPLLDSTGASYRIIQLSYRTFDGSLKLASYRFN